MQLTRHFHMNTLRNNNNISTSGSIAVWSTENWIFVEMTFPGAQHLARQWIGGKASFFVMRMSPARILSSWARWSTEPHDFYVAQVAAAGACGMHSQERRRCDAPPAMSSACLRGGTSVTTSVPSHPRCQCTRRSSRRHYLQHMSRKAPLTYSFLIDFRVAHALLFVIWSNLWRDLEETMFCSDASSRGYALLESPACAWETGELSQ